MKLTIFQDKVNMFLTQSEHFSKLKWTIFCFNLTNFQKLTIFGEKVNHFSPKNLQFSNTKCAIFKKKLPNYFYEEDNFLLNFRNFQRQI